VACILVWSKKDALTKLWEFLKSTKINMTLSYINALIIIMSPEFVPDKAFRDN
jgi:hypothetical protein